MSRASEQKELVDVYAPPRFERNGVVKTRQEVVADGDWPAAFNLWLYTRIPEPSMIYQMRSLSKSWEPGKLDVAAGGHYNAGEHGLDGLREFREELGITIPESQVQFFGRKLWVGLDVAGHERKEVLSVYTAEYSGNLEDMHPQEDELAGVIRVPLKDLMRVFRGELESCHGTGIDPRGVPIDYVVRADSFPFNFDDYQRRMAEFIALKLGVDDTYLGN